MEYQHTQSALQAVLFAVVWVFVVMAIVVILLTDFLSFAFLAGVLLFTAGITLMFSRLTVTIAGGEIDVAFGLGWPRRTMATADVQAVRRVRNSWFYGWGIRKIVGGWMYNVWGLEAIELDLSSGKKFRIGTDEPEQLLAALTLAIPSRNPGN